MKDESAAPRVEQSVQITRHIPAALNFAVQAFVIGVPVLYTLGRVYAEGYWKGIALSEALMNYSVEDYLYLGFTAIFNAAVRLVAWMPLGPIGTTLMVVAASAVVVIVILIAHRWLLPVLRERLTLVAHRVRAWKADDDNLAVQFSRPLVALWLAGPTMLFYFFLAFLCVSLPLIGAYSAGGESAKKDRKRLEGVGPATFMDARAIVHLKGKTHKQAGVLLDCSTEWCVVLRRGDFVAIHQEDVARIDHCPKTIILKNGALVCDADSDVRP